MTGTETDASLPTPPRGQSAAVSALVGFSPWIGALSAAGWSRWDAWPWLLLLLGAAVVGLLRFSTDSWRGRLASALVFLAFVVLGLGQFELRQIDTDYAGYWQGRRARAEEIADQRLTGIVLRGEEALEGIEDAIAGRQGDAVRSQLRRVRRRNNMQAVAVYGPLGDFQIWNGVHRGSVPEEVKRGDLAYSYRDRPLFSYLYFTKILPDGSTAVAAALMKSGLPEAILGNRDDFVTRFRAATGEDLRLLSPDRAFGPSVLDLTWDDRPLLSVSLVAPEVDARRAAVQRSYRLGAIFFVFGIWFVLATGRPGGFEGTWARHLMPIVLSLWLPVGILSGLGDVFGDGMATLSGLAPVSLGRALMVTVALAFSVAARRWRRAPFRPWVAGLLVMTLFPAVAMVAGGSSDPTFLAGTSRSWMAYQLTMALALGLVTAVGLRLGRSVRPAVSPIVATLVFLGSLLSVWWIGAWSVETSGDTASWILCLWAAPTFVAGASLGRIGRRNRVWIVWVVAAMIGGSAAQVHAWGHRLEALRLTAEDDLLRLGVSGDVDPEGRIDALLGEIQILDAEGADDRSLLFDAWTRSGLAAGGTSIWLTVWGPDGQPDFELPLGMGGNRPNAASAYLTEPLFGPVIRGLAEEDAVLLARAPLRDGRVFTAVMPPRRDVGLASPLAALVGGTDTRAGSPLRFVPLLEEEGVPNDRTVQWTRAPDRWEARLVVRYPEGASDVHYSVVLPGRGVLSVRAGLILFADIAVLGMIWMLGQFMFRRRHLDLTRWRPLATFRSKVTLALFGFFLLSNLLFGTLMLRTLRGATERTATALVSRVVSDAAAFYEDMDRSMSRLSQRVGAELLEYRDGELRGGSVDELVELGLYEGWLPFEVHQALKSGSAPLLTSLSTLGSTTYLDAFSRLPDGDVVGTLVPLQAGSTALRGREVAELLALITILGAGLSFGLALLVGRTLTQPIRTLQLASERVGAGHLKSRLPGDRVDEFGSVFGAFNRMVLRIQRARRALVRTTRRTQAIVEEVATGVIALDPEGAVTLVNPRAQALMGGTVVVGAPLEATSDLRGEFVRWVDGCARDGLRESTTEFQFDERRIRVRARRISKEGAGGMVLSMEDVTDELRTERVLAWGEMARQVAHEVKNPLTPIKLSVQHIQRAWNDQRPDFDPVLKRNVEVILGEIDSLDSIARSFSKFGAPAAAGASPVSPVDVQLLAREVITLYSSGGDGPVSFTMSVPDGLPLVVAREAEFKEVLLNLLENARAAIEGKGSVVVQAVAVPDEVEVRVRDDGSGIPPELIGRIFEPRFSTRSTGTGLGLAIVRRVVESWGGGVTAESGRGEGTVIRLRLRTWTAEMELAGPADPDVAT